MRLCARYYTVLFCDLHNELTDNQFKSQIKLQYDGCMQPTMVSLVSHALYSLVLRNNNYERK